MYECQNVFCFISINSKSTLIYKDKKKHVNIFTIDIWK